MSQKEKLEILKTSLNKHRVVTIEQICKILGVKSRMSAHRYLQQIDYLTSYSHGGKYYTLRKTAEFDQFGLWYSGDIGFSTHGTLLETIVHLVADSEKGKTTEELTRQCRLRVQNALLQLVKEKKLSREKTGNIYRYLGEHDLHKKRRQKKHTTDSAQDSLSEWIVIDVLVEIIRKSKEIIHPTEIAASLQKRGSSISLHQVQQVFQLHSLEKKHRISRSNITDHLAQSGDYANQLIESFSYQSNNSGGVGTNRLLWRATPHAKNRRTKYHHAEHWQNPYSRNDKTMQNLQKNLRLRTTKSIGASML